MSRYIDADELIEAMWRSRVDSRERIQELILIQPTADVVDKNECSKCVFYPFKQLREQQWVPCGERLPETSGRYLVTRGLNACGSLWNRVYIVNYSDLMGLKKEKIWWDGNVGKSDFQTYEDVLAWQPLPEPWKGDSNEQIQRC